MVIAAPGSYPAFATISVPNLFTSSQKSYARSIELVLDKLLTITGSFKHCALANMAIFENLLHSNHATEPESEFTVVHIKTCYWEVHEYHSVAVIGSGEMDA